MMMKQRIQKILLLSLLMIFFTLVHNANADTNVSGVISSNTAWTLANSPYIVKGNILVQQGVTLTIQPGVVVKFDGAYYLQVDGELIANGTVNSKITFTSNKPNPAPSDWSGIWFTDTCIDAKVDGNNSYLSGSIINYVLLEYGRGISIVSSYPYLTNNLIINNDGSGRGSDSVPGAIEFKHYTDSNKTLIVENNIIENNKLFRYSWWLLGVGYFRCKEIY